MPLWVRPLQQQEECSRAQGVSSTRTTCSPFHIWGNRAPERCEGLSKVPEPAHARPRPMWGPAVCTAPVRTSAGMMTTRPFTAPGPSYSRLEDSRRWGEADAPLSCPLWWLQGLLKPVGCVRRKEGLTYLSGPPGWLQRPQKQPRDPDRNTICQPGMMVAGSSPWQQCSVKASWHH